MLKMNRTTVWKIVKKFKETGKTLDKPGQSHRKLAAQANMNNSTMYQVMKDDLGKKPYKMLHRHELAEHHKRMRMERSLQILDEIDQLRHAPQLSVHG